MNFHGHPTATFLAIISGVVLIFALVAGKALVPRTVELALADRRKEPRIYWFCVVLYAITFACNVWTLFQPANSN